MLTKVKGDLLKMFDNGAFDVIVHGCNCFHTMGSGIAGQISERYPEALDADKQSFFGDIDKLGRYTIAQSKSGFIINGYTQFRPGQEQEQRLYSSISTLFDNLSNDLSDGSKIGIPKIGAGIAGGNWSVIEELIKIRMTNMKVIVVEYVPPVVLQPMYKNPKNLDMDCKMPMSEFGLCSWMD